MKLLIDIGNTSTKLAIADGDRLVHHERLAEPWSDALERLAAAYAIERVVISCVGRVDAALCALFPPSGVASRPLVEGSSAPTCLWLRHDTPCALQGVPAGYGADRLAADIGAYTGQHALLVVDVGTCITYDLIVDGRLAGGVISPGMQLRLDAMHDHTAALPALRADVGVCVTGDASRRDGTSVALMGTDTESCMLSAACYGVGFEVEGYVRALLSCYPDLDVVLTGGNRVQLSEDINHQYDALLLMRGLMKL